MKWLVTRGKKVRQTIGRDRAGKEIVQDSPRWSKFKITMSKVVQNVRGRAG